MPEDAAAQQKRPGARAGQGWCLPRPVLKFGQNLTSQQLWCWGRDVEHQDGNLLMHYGFERHRSRGASKLATCYRLEEDDCQVYLWGFGLFFGRRNVGGIYLGRFNFRPAWSTTDTLSTDIHNSGDLPEFGRPRGRQQWQEARKLWVTMMSWITDYEQWIRSSFGNEYREECINAWMNPFVSAHEMLSAWQFLSCRQWEHRDEPLAQTLRRYTLPAVPS